MTEPQSTTDVGLPSVPDLSTAPEADEEPSEDTLSNQVAKTDAALHAWRSESVKRRAAWEAARVRAEAEMFEQRRKVMRFGGATLLAAILTVVGVSALVHNLRTSSDARSEARVFAPRPPLARIAVAEGVALPPEAAPPSEVAVEAPAAAPSPIELQPGSVRLWNEAGHVWAAFATTERGPVQFRYVDGSGREALDPMGCTGPDATGVRHCSAGRSRTRIARAIEHGGAAPGNWTVQACGAAGCADLGTFPVR